MDDGGCMSDEGSNGNSEYHQMIPAGWSWEEIHRHNF